MSIFQFISEVARHKVAAKQYEAYKTPEWAIERILDVELLTPHVVDPCCGDGVLTYVARRRGYKVQASDIFDWGCKRSKVIDFLSDYFGLTFRGDYTTVLMNPPFSKATDFVERAHQLGARKIVCFQRFAWWESQKRNEFWNEYPPARVYVCGDRATCWLFGTPEENRKNGTTTAHAWFIWEQGQQSNMPALGRLYREAA